MIIDIDNFKIINDSYGHDTGDAILQDFSEKYCIACGFMIYSDAMAVMSFPSATRHDA